MKRNERNGKEINMRGNGGRGLRRAMTGILLAALLAGCGRSERPAEDVGVQEAAETEDTEAAGKEMAETEDTEAVETEMAETCPMLPSLRNCRKPCCGSMPLMRALLTATVGTGGGSADRSPQRKMWRSRNISCIPIGIYRIGNPG